VGVGWPRTPQTEPALVVRPEGPPDPSRATPQKRGRDVCYRGFGLGFGLVPAPPAGLLFAAGCSWLTRPADLRGGQSW